MDAEQGYERIPTFTQALKKPADSFRTYVKTMNEQELPKVVCSEKKRLALGHLSLFHLPPIITTLLLFSFYVSKLKWTHPTNEQLNALQFAAKAHEALIIISLTDILLHRICYNLVQGDGLPLGFLASAFHLGSPVQYLMSWELWSALVRPNSNTLLHRMTGALIVIISLLAIGSGPVSAIIMIPRQGWWHKGYFPHETTFSTCFYINGSLFESDLRSQHAQNALGSTTTRLRTEQRLGLEGLLPVLASTQFMPEAALPYVTNVFIENVTYSAFEELGVLKRPISLFSDFSTAQADYLVTATCPMAIVATALNLYPFITQRTLDGQRDENQWLVRSALKKGSYSELQKWKQPLVAISCSDATMNDGAAAFDFNSKVLNDSVHLDIKDNSGLRELAEISSQPGPVGYRFLSLHNSVKQPHSGSILFATRVNYTWSSGENGNSTWQPLNPSRLELSLCFISAYWAQADSWMERGLNQVQSHLDPPIDDVFADSTNIITIRDDWFTGIDFPNITSLNSSYTQILSFCANNYNFLTFCLPITLATHITDALSQPSAYFTGDMNELDVPNTTMVQSMIYQRAFSYNFQNSRTIPFAFAILLVHIMIVLVHISIVLSSNSSWHSNSWGNIGQMLILALRSNTPKNLGNIGGGVTSSQTWRRTATIRAPGENYRVEIVLVDDEGIYAELRDRTELGYLSESQERLKPGVQYF